MYFLLYIVPEVIPSTSLMVSEGESAHFCVSLKGTLREIVQILIETGDENAIGMFVCYTCTAICFTICYYFSQL